MADKSLFGRLQRLFSTNVIVRNVGGKKLNLTEAPRVPRKKGQHRGSKSHSDLYTTDKKQKQ